MTLPTAVVYGEYLDASDGQLVFLLERDALEQQASHRAIREARTWAEFWARLPEDVRAELEDALDWCDEDLPRDDTPFRASDLPGYDDGDFPPTAPAYGTGWLPASIAEAYGVKEHSFVSGTWTEIPAGHEAAVVDALRALGFVVRRDDGLVSSACGY